MKINGINVKDTTFRANPTNNVQTKQVNENANKTDKKEKKYDTLKTLGFIAIGLGALYLLHKSEAPAPGRRNGQNRESFVDDVLDIAGDVAGDVASDAAENAAGNLIKKAASKGIAAGESIIGKLNSSSEGSLIDHISDIADNL